ncbi:cytochrome b5 reductase 4 isoform X4 [Trachemys scripta elegans]|uniref:cytochrome b5 reductase 4 isoform X4 n=1 Tax=Trachemys scripta elegans TaxID=31138 RepID=UPI0015532217|nr:cytochrome b5 reductase 4 isoform X4 [Trachemys scripta elegans]
MLNVPAQAFPASGSQQRAAAGGRSKVPLKPGRSLMDWIRLTKSGKDLTGLKGRLIEVTEEELAKHSKKDDCWICIRGLVYNVTPYMEYHPGGDDELMRAAGTDGTDLFDQVHRWVNYESMLKECLVGRMALKPVAATTETCCALPEEKKLLNGILPKNKVLDTSSKDLTPSYDWFQTDYLVTVVIYTKQKGMNSEMVIVDHQDGRLRVDSILRDYSYLLHIGLYYRKCKLISKTEVTHDTKLFCLMLPQSTHLQVPVGHHIYLKQIIAGTEIVKPYTPVSCSLKSDFKEPSHHDSTHLILMIKIYPNGLFTPELDHLQIGDYISVSNSEGSFKKSQVQTLEDLFLLAAGTGFTPMVKLLNYVLTNVCGLRTVKLMFFNKTEDDILWRNQLEQLALKDKRFEVQFILSEPKKEGTGKQGKISSSLLSEFVKRSKKDSEVLICVCGPAPFTEQGIQFLQDLGYSKEEIHSFTA